MVNICRCNKVGCMGECNILPPMTMYTTNQTIDTRIYKLNLEILDRVINYYKNQDPNFQMIENKFKEFKKLIYGV